MNVKDVGRNLLGDKSETQTELFKSKIHTHEINLIKLFYPTARYKCK